MNETQSSPAIIVDPYSSGAFYADAFDKVGVKTIAVMSANEPPDVYAPSFRPQDFDRIFVASEHKISELVASLKALHPSCILTGCESGVELTDRIAPMVLPDQSNSPDKAEARRHKGEMARAVEAAGLPGMRQICTDSVEEVAAWIEKEGLTGKDLVIKPPKSASTDGVNKVSGDSNWRSAFLNQLGSVNRLGLTNSKLVVQEFLQGVEFAVDTASFSGSHSVANICRYNKVYNGPFMAIYDTMEWMPADFAEGPVLKHYAFQVLDAVGMRYGTSHIEIMMTNEGPRLIEIGARPHGGGHPQFCRHATGDSQVDRIARCFVDNGFSRENYDLKTHLTVVFLMCRQGGVVSNRAVLDAVAELPSYHFSKYISNRMIFLNPLKTCLPVWNLDLLCLHTKTPDRLLPTHNSFAVGKGSCLTDHMPEIYFHTHRGLLK